MYSDAISEPADNSHIFIVFGYVEDDPYKCTCQIALKNCVPIVYQNTGGPYLVLYQGLRWFVAPQEYKWGSYVVFDIS